MDLQILYLPLLTSQIIMLQRCSGKVQGYFALIEADDGAIKVTLYNQLTREKISGPGTEVTYKYIHHHHHHHHIYTGAPI